MDYSIEDKSKWAITAVEHKGHTAAIHRSPSPPGGWGCRIHVGPTSQDFYRIDGAKTVFELQSSFADWVDAGMPSPAEQMAELSKKNRIEIMPMVKEADYPSWVNQIYQKLEQIPQGTGRAAFVRATDGANMCIQISHMEWLNNTESGRKLLIFKRGSDYDGFLALSKVEQVG